MHQLMAATLDQVVAEIRRIQSDARERGVTERPRWPMIVLKTPKGWTGPKVVDGLPVEGTYRAHQVPLSEPTEHPEHLKLLESWMRSYRPEELFDESGRLIPELPSWPPRASAGWGPTRTPTAASCSATCGCPTSATTPSTCPQPGQRHGRGHPHPGQVPPRRDQAQRRPAQLPHLRPRRDRLQPADRRLRGDQQAVGGRGRRRPTTTSPPTGRVMEMLSEHQCEGWLEGYLLTGRHGLFNSYEAFIHIIDSMFNQHAKWLKVTRHIPWRRPIASLNILLASHVWRQDHNGFTHQDPGFIDHVVNKKAEVIRVYLPPDTNYLLSVMDHCLRSRHYVNVDRRQQAPVAAVARHGRRRSSTARRASASGSGPATTRGASPTSSWPAPATCRRWRPWPPSSSCASTSRS